MFSNLAMMSMFGGNNVSEMFDGVFDFGNDRIIHLVLFIDEVLHCMNKRGQRVVYRIYVKYAVLQTFKIEYLFIGGIDVRHGLNDTDPLTVNVTVSVRLIREHDYPFSLADSEGLTAEIHFDAAFKNEFQLHVQVKMYR